MIEWIEVWNFQSWKHRRVDFDPAVTSLIGDNDRGKTALIRAAMLVCLNPYRSADRFIRHGAKGFKVSIRVDGHTVTRVKGKSKNHYLLDGKRYKFDGTRIKVPAEVSKVLNVARENFCLQHDAHFWFSETPGQVSKRLNEIVNLQAVDRSLKAANAGVKTATEAVELGRRAVKDTRHNVKTMNWVSGFAGRVERLGRAEARAGILAERSQGLESALSEYRSGLAGAKRLGRAYRAAERVVKMGKVAASRAAKLKRLNKLLRDHLDAVRASKLRVPDLSKLLKLRKRGDAVAERRRRLEYLIEDLLTARAEVCRLNDELSELESKLRRARKKVKKCPRCGQPIKKSSPLLRPICTSGHAVQSPGRRKRTG